MMTEQGKPAFSPLPWFVTPHEDRGATITGGDGRKICTVHGVPDQQINMAQADGISGIALDHLKRQQREGKVNVSLIQHAPTLLLTLQLAQAVLKEVDPVLTRPGDEEVRSNVLSALFSIDVALHDAMKALG